MKASDRTLTRHFLAVIGASLLVACCFAFPSAAFSRQHGGTSLAAQSLMVSSASKPSDSDPVFDTIMRFELKRELLQSADEFQVLQQEMFAAKAMEQEEQKKNTKRRKWFRRGRNSDPIGGAFGAQSFASIKVDLGEKGDEVIALAERLSALNTNDNPMLGWKGYDGGSPDECPLDGNWKLRFTSGADATFPESNKRGKATTSQIVDATEGTLTNTVDFEKGKVKGFRVVVEGTAVSDTEMNLNFKKVIIQRDTRFPRLLGRISIRLPSSRLLSAYARFASRGKSQQNGPSGPGFEIQYMDNDLRMHKTRDGIWFIQSKY